ncbi:hypothetical protein ATANTOWER_025620 [Ataeniobius toweri]|uniref:G-protein coupled receptors family 1 profile domain-containing protein n=1 Tax=Ataeniobius toweri TaxID=208326 RepID=A0ABU7AB97_9TELE|nr:hypothetical protein [Ataeniobius toweri]
MVELHFTVVPSNFSSSHLPSPSWNSNGLIPAVVLSLCFILGVPGNIAVILLKPNWQNMSSLSQSLMLNLAISDLLCLLTLPLWIYTLLHSWTFGVGTCKLLSGLVYCSVQGSQMTVFAMSIQRYVVVVHRKSCKQVRKGVLLGLIWLVAVILSIPTLVVRQLKKEQKWTQCQPKYSSDAQRVAVLLTEATVGLACISLVAFAYINLHRKGVTGRCSCPASRAITEELLKQLRPWRRHQIVYSAEWLLTTRTCSGSILCGSGFTLLVVTKPASWRTRCGSASA